MRGLLVYNPNATTTNAAVTDVIARALSAELKLEVEATKRRDHAGYLAAGAVHEGFDVVVALGGDGTLNEVVQGVAKTSTKLALIPGGSTNVFARSLGLPDDAVEATSIVCRKLRDGEDRTVSLGMANGRYFTFCAGWGLDAEIVRMVERRAMLKRTVRQATFLWCGLLAYLGGGARGDITVRADGDDPVTGLRTVVCCNADPYTYLGARPGRMCPEADLAGALDVTGLTRARFHDLARVTWTALTSDEVPDLPRVRTWHDRARYTLDAAEALPLHVDGELLGVVPSLTLTSVPEALTVVA